MKTMTHRILGAREVRWRTGGNGKNNRPSRAHGRIYARPPLKISTPSPDINTCHVHSAVLARKHSRLAAFDFDGARTIR